MLLFRQCFFVIVLVKCILSSDPRKLPKARIIGGILPPMHKYHYMVGIFGTSTCGGTLITLKWILTAAHCLTTRQIRRHEVLIRSGLQRTDPKLIQKRFALVTVQHPKFLEDKMKQHGPELRYDIGLVLVDSPFEENGALSTVTLPSLNFASKCTKGVVLGIGKTDPASQSKRTRPLQAVTLTIVNSSVCQESYIGSVIDDTILCTREKKGGKDACYGDSGGPMLCLDTDVIIGIVSFGKGCGIPRKSSTFTKVESYLDFIKETLAREEILKETLLNESTYELNGSTYGLNRSTYRLNGSTYRWNGSTYGKKSNWKFLWVVIVVLLFE